MAAADMHREYLKQLCRLCGGKLNKDPVNVSLCISKIKNVYFIDISTDLPSIHPPKICQACYVTMRNVENRKTTTCLKIYSWDNHSQDCKVCSHIESIKKGGRKPKKAKTGRPSNNKKIWSRSIINNIMSKIPANNNYNINITDLRQDLNIHLELCICNLCENLLKLPVTFKNASTHSVSHALFR